MPESRTVNLTNRELQLIVEALLYCASTDIDHSRYQEDLLDTSQLAIKLRLQHQDISTSNVFFLHSEDNLSDYTSELLKYFPELTYII